MPRRPRAIRISRRQGMAQMPALNIRMALNNQNTARDNLISCSPDAFPIPRFLIQAVMLQPTKIPAGNNAV